jgi:hypothetical protein
MKYEKPKDAFCRLVSLESKIAEARASLDELIAERASLAERLLPLFDEAPVCVQTYGQYSRAVYTRVTRVGNTLNLEILEPDSMYDIEWPETSDPTTLPISEVA